MRSLLLRISCSVLSIIFTLLLCEAGLRLFAPQATYSSFSSIDAPVFKESSSYPWELSANHKGMQISPYGEYISSVSINSIGTRGPEPQVGGTTKRILFLGDSFTYGYGVSEPAAFPRLIESRLNFHRNTSFPFEVINAGYAAGYSPDSYYAYLKRNIKELDPKIVVLALYTGNDVEDMGRNVWDEVDSQGLPSKLSTKDF